MIARFSVSVIACTHALHASAADVQPAYPTKPIRLIVAYAPGGGNDIVARLVAPPLSARFGQQVIVDNRTGAGGTVGAALVAKAEPDGYTMFVSSLGTHAVGPNLFRNPGYDPVRDFAPISLLAITPIVLVVNRTLPEVTSVQALIAAAKARPGDIRYASGGFGAPPHTAAAVFESMTGTRMQHVPYKGGGPAIIGLHAGETNVMFGPAATMLAQARAGRVRALAIARPTRHPGYPEVPTFAEQGLPDYSANTWFGVHAPARTASALTALWNRELVRIVNLPDMQERFNDSDLERVGSTAAEFDRFVRNEVAKYARVVKETGMEAK
jgi:tripartite-type tricarboxylate transporter receptor subunit TctC